MTAPHSHGRGARPNPIQWIGYTLGRRLPDSMREWVRNDLTGNHATTRHMIRGMVPFLPLFTAFLLLPGAVWLRGSTALLALLLALFYCAVYMPVNRSRRLTQHGLPAVYQPTSRIRPNSISIGPNARPTSPITRDSYNSARLVTLARLRTVEDTLAIRLDAYETRALAFGVIGSTERQ